ncbi:MULTISPECIES: hypothetical protein [Citricoccus]|uniref:hypothetical protein n=1 Tax=Citricoccus TaxID=169133 RepID=UPI000255EF84|nr:hypothetical protein [Citricoccus sp. CH26A]
MAMDFDAQLIESVEVRRNRLTAAFLFGANPTERRWRERTRVLVYGVVTAALACALCVAISFVVMVITNWQDERAEREQRQSQSLNAAPSSPLPGRS